jgi:hypothetical protein
VVVGGAERVEIAYLEEPVAVSDEVLAMAQGVNPMEVFRTTAPCAESKCQHFSGSHCKLGERLSQELAKVASTLPPCSIRSACRWFSERGADACLRCAQVVTDRPVAVRSEDKSRRQLRVV